MTFPSTTVEELPSTSAEDQKEHTNAAENVEDRRDLNTHHLLVAWKTLLASRKRLTKTLSS